MHSQHTILTILLAAVAPLAAAAPEMQAPGAAQATAAPVQPGRLRPVPPATLAQLRGGSGGIASDTQVRGTVDGNTAAHVVTGNNVIDAGSFANAAGIPVVIQNSGANVLIQNATVVNVQFK